MKTPRWWVVAIVFFLLGLLLGCTTSTEPRFATRCTRPDTVWVRAPDGTLVPATIQYCLTY